MKESVGYIYSLIYRHYSDVFRIKKFLTADIERAYAEALKEGVIEEEIINDEIRYRTNYRLKRFVNECWFSLQYKTENLVRNADILEVHMLTFA